MIQHAAICQCDSLYATQTCKEHTRYHFELPDQLKLNNRNHATDLFMKNIMLLFPREVHVHCDGTDKEKITWMLKQYMTRLMFTWQLILKHKTNMLKSLREVPIEQKRYNRNQSVLLKATCTCVTFLREMPNISASS